MSTYTRTLPGVPGAAGAAREYLAEILADCPARDDALLCVSELVTNAIQHSRSAGPAGLIRLRLEAEPGQPVQIDVQDDGPAPVSPSLPDDEHGRGLLLIAALADAYTTNGLGLHSCRLAWDPQHEREPQMNSNQGAAAALSIPESEAGLPSGPYVRYEPTAYDLGLTDVPEVTAEYGPSLPSRADLNAATAASAAVLDDPEATWAERQQVLEAEEAVFLAYEAAAPLYPQLEDPEVNRMVTERLLEAELEAGI
jgi:anti-sigma regulatory factor (Ser/Thr protein kinase)